MGLPRKVSDSDIDQDKTGPMPVPVKMAMATTTARATMTGQGPATTIATPSSTIPTNKKRKREALELATAAAAISDDSSDDEEKVCTTIVTSNSEQRHPLALCNKKRRKQRRRRRVVFGDAASTTKYYAATLSKSELRDMKSELWYTKQDRMKSQDKCLQLLKVFRIRNAEEVAQFSAVYRISMEVPYSRASSDYLEQATVSVPLIIRGLEWGITPKLKKRRKQHIQNILAVQTHIHDTEIRERFVASRSLQSSRPARIMARMIGEGDANANRSKLGTTTTTTFMAPITRTSTITSTTTTTGKSKVAQQQLQQTRNKGINASKTTRTPRCRGSTTGTKTTTKIGHARRRRQFLWRK